MRRHRSRRATGDIGLSDERPTRRDARAAGKRLRGSRDRRSPNSNASDRCATPDGDSNGHASGTDNGVRGSSNTLVRLVVGRSLAGSSQRLRLVERRQSSSGRLNTTISWSLSLDVSAGALLDRI